MSFIYYRHIAFIWLLLPFLTVTSISIADEFATKAKQAIAVEHSSGEVLFENNADEIMSPSSMSKLMTLYIAFNQIKSGLIKEDDIYTVSRKAWQRGGSSMFLMEGQRVKVIDLLHGIAITSGNDACIALAEGSMGTEENFVREMNKTAKSIGILHSNFANSSGWPDPNHYMTARDLVKLAIKIYENFPEYYYLFSKRIFSYNNITQNNSNEMLQKSSITDGIKTGMTDKGGFGVVISAAEGKKRVFIVVNGLQNKAERLQEVDKLLRYVINNFETKTVFRKGDIIGDIEVVFGKKDRLSIIAPEDLIVIYKKEEKPNVKIKLVYDNRVEAPVEIGKEIARIVIDLPNKQPREITVQSNCYIPRNSWFKAMLQKLYKAA